MKNISIKQKIAFSLLFAVLFTSVVIAGMNLYRVSGSVEKAVSQRELPATMSYISAKIDKEIALMQAIAQQIATDPLILAWNQQGQSADGERLLIRKLATIAEQNGLSAASFADKQSAKYWNQDGFLRQLQNDQRDGWFFNYIASHQANMVSTYRYPDGSTDLFVNYQQLMGQGLSGTAKSFETVINFLNEFTLAKSGFVYLADQSGQVQIHHDEQLLQTASLSSLYGADAASSLLSGETFALTEVNQQGQALVVATAYIPSMNWYVVAEIPKAEIYADVTTMLIESTFWTLAVTLVIGVLGWWLAARLTGPLARQARLFTRLGQGNADLTYRLPVEGEAEIQAMAGGYNAFAQKLEQIFDVIKRDSAEVNGLALKIRQDANATMHSCEQTDTNIGHIAAAMAQISAAVSDIAENASGATQAAQEVDNNRDQIAQVISQSRGDIEALVTKIHDVNQVISRLNDNTQTIAGVLEVIQSISDQTNLLALNAAIEAARAGEQGRGFSVVADEVRSLAAKTADSTLEIQGIIEQLRLSASSVSSEISEIVAGSQQTAESIMQAEEILGTNKQKFAHILDISRQIAVATEQQSYSIKDINDNMGNISDLSADNIRHVSTMAEQTLSLTDLSETLDAQVAGFQRASK